MRRKQRKLAVSRVKLKTMLRKLKRKSWNLTSRKKRRRKGWRWREDPDLVAPFTGEDFGDVDGGLHKRAQGALRVARAARGLDL